MEDAMPKISLKDARQLAGLELNAVAVMGVIPATAVGGARIAAAGTTIYDVNGTPLFYRVPLQKRGGPPGFIDLAADDAFGEALLATTYGAGWNEAAIREQATAEAVRAKRGLRFDAVRFVGYSYPKVAVQFLSGNQEVLMLECWSWAEVPPAAVSGRKPMEPGNFERWSLLDELPTARRRANEQAFGARANVWRETIGGPRFRGFEPARIDPAKFPIDRAMIKLFDARELHYSTDDKTHVPCYELSGQATNVWCVAASTQMLLGFWRYEYTQDRIAQALGLGTRATPNGLPYSRVADVVTQIEALTSNALDATMVTNPGFAVFRDEIRANRPLISFVPGHSRTVAGYYSSMIHLPAQLPFKGLLVYDPWPPNAGTIHRYENFNTQTYQYAYHAHLTLV
jgi:hypothetical protein